MQSWRCRPRKRLIYITTLKPNQRVTVLNFLGILLRSAVYYYGILRLESYATDGGFSAQLHSKRGWSAPGGQSVGTEQIMGDKLGKK